MDTSIFKRRFIGPATFISMILPIGWVLTSWRASFVPLGLVRIYPVDLPEAKRGLLPDREWKQAVEVSWRWRYDQFRYWSGGYVGHAATNGSGGATLANRGKISTGGHGERPCARQWSLGQFDELNRIPDWAWETIIGGMKKVVHRGNQRLWREWNGVGLYRSRYTLYDGWKVRYCASGRH